MLNENIRTLRKAKGLSQEELALRLNVVRQTVSKWEQGLSVPDSDLLISLAEALDTPVGVLLGETLTEDKTDELKVISEKLEIINLRLTQSRNAKRKRLTVLFALIVVIITAIFIFLVNFESRYLGWDYSDPETAVVGVILHAFEWFFVRLSPFILIGSALGIFLIHRRK